jgi:hypothetical protein
MLSFFRSLFSELMHNQLGGITMVRTGNKTESVTTNPAPATLTDQVTVLEKEQENNDLDLAHQPTDLLPQESIRSEVNFLTLPFFALSDADVRRRTETEYKDVVQRDGQKLEIQWNVAAHQKYGYPSPFDRKVHRAIEHIISGMKPPIQNPIPLGSLASLAKLIGLRVSKRGAAPGWFYDQIQEAILRIRHTAIESKGTFYHKDEKKWMRDSFSLYERAIFIGEKLPNGEIADTNYLYLGSWYLDNINARYTKPLDYTYYRTLHRPISARLYELLGVKFYGNPLIRYRYSNLCQLLPATRYQYLSKAKEKLEPAHQELIATKFLANVQWEQVKDDPHDWYVTYYPGTRAIEEIQQAKKQGELPPPEDRGATLQALPAPVAPQPTASDADDVVNALQKFGITKKQAQKLAKDYPEEDILAQLDYVKCLAENQSPLVSKNPQGYLIKAIQDDYPIPPQYQRKAQQDREAEERQQREEREQQERVAAREQAREHLQQQHPPQPIAGTEHTTATAWTQTLAALQPQVPQGTYLTWLKDTLLVTVEDNTAFILVSSRQAREYLERRLFGLIARSLEQVLGYPVDVEFVVAPSDGD